MSCWGTPRHSEEEPGIKPVPGIEEPGIKPVTFRLPATPLYVLSHMPPPIDSRAGGAGESHSRRTFGRGVVVRVCVALTAVLHQKVGVVPGHAHDAVRLVQKDMCQHSAVAVHHDHLSIRRAKQHLDGDGNAVLIPRFYKTKEWQKHKINKTKQN